MFYKLTMALTLVIAFCSSSVAKQVKTEDYQQRLDSLASAYQAVYGFSGTVKIVKAGQPLIEKSYGLADRSFNIENSVNHRFSINSISKAFTAVAVMQLVEGNKIRLDQSIDNYLPELDTEWKDKVTVHHLLTHTSGLPRESGVQWYDELSLEQQVKQLINQQTLLFSPGERYEYSNSGITLLGRIIENVSGEPFSAYMNNHIIDPLGLANTGVYVGQRVVARQAVPYRMTTNGVAMAQRTKHLGQNAGGGMYSTVSDLYSFVTSLEKNQLLSEKTRQLMFKPQVEMGGGDFSSYGWTLKPFGEQILWFASGSGYGTKSVLVRAPESDDFIAVTSNWGNTPILKLMAGLFLIINDMDYDIPDEGMLAKPSRYEAFLGTYVFDAGQLNKHLMTDTNSMTLQEVDGRLFLNDELLAQKDNGILGLTYTNEVQIEVNQEHMVIIVNDNWLVGKLQK
ncbi:hypothetical protein CEW91_05275 [Idiomarina piscisalsi]|uniref:Beta-lactamase-related domain-containing protein n=1 Tax=Idiomarina piscisalsi TaxID=1096243 RepID=A0ABM6LSU7_9GAMM|nr:serine hydrolase domain-containing protein [Idiomarina piscisalsi]ASG65581.1 hypothetical protein CEW91_05275 [Idiomarina piscisalsi]